MHFAIPRPVAAIVAGGILLAAATPAAAISTFRATLSGANETVPNTSPGTGTGLFTLSNDGNLLTVAITYGGLTAPTIAGHLHCCAAQGANGPVAIGFTFPSATSGTIAQTFNLAAATGTYSGGFVTASGGTAALARTAFLNGLGAGLVYANIHSGPFPGGEIRGQVNAVPEPGTWALMVAGFGLVGTSVRRRRVAVA